MYKDQHKWLEIAMMLLDVALSGISFILAGIIRYGNVMRFSGTIDFIELMIITVFFSLTSFILTKMYANFFIRGYLREMHHVLIYTALIALLITLYSFLTKNSLALSRLTLVYFSGINTAMLYGTHILMKKIITIRLRNRQTWKLLIISDAENVESTCRDILNSDWKNRAVGVILLDEQTVDAHRLGGIKLIKPPVNCMNYITQNTVDQVVVSLSTQRYWSAEVQALLPKIAATGVIVGIKNCLTFFNENYACRLSKIGSSYILSYANREYDYLMILVKRTMDILGGLVGSMITVVIGLVLAPAILIETRGPLFFTQKRVGRNGRIFTMLKFRSMYVDAESKKAVLMEKNKMKGPLFKISDDPRVTRVGKFIRKTSLDEFPQFFNVLIGDMSLVGTRPPTVDEYKQYDYYQKKRLSFCPGITGIWQVSGRNNITDFDDVMKMDIQYIEDWSIYLDVKLILKTVVAVFSRRGAQ